MPTTECGANIFMVRWQCENVPLFSVRFIENGAGRVPYSLRSIKTKQTHQKRAQVLFEICSGVESVYVQSLWIRRVYSGVCLCVRESVCITDNEIRFKSIHSLHFAILIQCICSGFSSDGVFILLLLREYFCCLPFANIRICVYRVRGVKANGNNCIHTHTHIKSDKTHMSQEKHISSNRTHKKKILINREIDREWWQSE